MRDKLVKEWESGVQAMLLRIHHHGAYCGGYSLDPVWFASLWPDWETLCEIEIHRIKGFLRSALTKITMNKKSKSKRSGNVSIGLASLLILVAIKDGGLNMTYNLKLLRFAPDRVNDFDFGFKIAVKEGLATFELLEIVEDDETEELNR